jgi:hypothetical protein
MMDCSCLVLTNEVRTHQAIEVMRLHLPSPGRKTGADSTALRPRLSWMVRRQSMGSIAILAPVLS